MGSLCGEKENCSRRKLPASVFSFSLDKCQKYDVSIIHCAVEITKNFSVAYEYCKLFK